MITPPSRPTSEWLQRALNFFEGTAADWNDAAREDGAKREVLAVLMQEITQLIREIGVPEPHLAPLQALNVALYNVSRGARDPLLVVKVNSRPRAGWEFDRRRVWGAALVRWLKPMEGKDAHALIAKEFRQAGHKGYNGKVLTAATVRKWCELVTEGGDRGPEERLVEKKLEKWRKAEAELQQPLKPVDFVRYVAVGLMKTR